MALPLQSMLFLLAICQIKFSKVVAQSNALVQNVPLPPPDPSAMQAKQGKVDKSLRSPPLPSANSGGLIDPQTAPSQRSASSFGASSNSGGFMDPQSDPSLRSPSSFGASGFMDPQSDPSQRSASSFGASDNSDSFMDPQSDPSLRSPSSFGESNDNGMEMRAATPKDARAQIRYCYAHGPLLPTSLLPKPKMESHVNVNSVSCEEIIGYLMGLNRWYDRKCSNMGPDCPHKYRYAVGWFNVAVKTVKQRCHLAL